MNNYNKNIKALNKLYNDDNKLNDIEKSIRNKYKKNQLYLRDLNILLDDTIKNYQKIIKKLH